jgi:hypothetical protein
MRSEPFDGGVALFRITNPRQVWNCQGFFGLLICWYGTGRTMKRKSLRRIVKSLKTVLVELGAAGLKDRDIRHRYAEFLVALTLAKRGHSVQVLAEREDRSADIYLPDGGKRVEVKSCKAHDEGEEADWAYASFGHGNQIKGKKFDYCVFVIFDKSSESVREIFVFTRNELKEVAKVRKGLAAHEDTNPCLLICAPTLKAYERGLKEWEVTPLRIERHLRKHPRRYMNAWSKIK